MKLPDYAVVVNSAITLGETVVGECSKTQLFEAVSRELAASEMVASKICGRSQSAAIKRQAMVSLCYQLEMSYMQSVCNTGKTGLLPPADLCDRSEFVYVACSASEWPAGQRNYL